MWFFESANANPDLVQDYRPVIEPTLTAIFADASFLHEEFSPEDKQTALSIFLK